MKTQLMNLLACSTLDLAVWLKTWTDISGHDYYLKVPPGAKKSDKRVILVAHIDKSRDNKEIDVLYDKKYQTYWSPQGLGADDRAGVYGILQVYGRLPAKMKPYLLFCDKEESGGIGAKEAAEDLKFLAKRISFMIELDRKGMRDAVFYNNESSKFKKYIEKFGFEKTWGTYSDISTIGRAWKIASVNLSVGYFDQHTYYERLEYDLLRETIKDTELIVRDAAIAKKVWNLPKEKPYVAPVHRTTVYPVQKYNHGSFCVCWRCKEDKIANKVDDSKATTKRLVWDSTVRDYVLKDQHGIITPARTDLERYNDHVGYDGFPGGGVIAWFWCPNCLAEYQEDNPNADEFSNSWCPRCKHLGEFAGQEFDYTN